MTSCNFVTNWTTRMHSVLKKLGLNTKKVHECSKCNNMKGFLDKLIYLFGEKLSMVIDVWRKIITVKWLWLFLSWTLYWQWCKEIRQKLLSNFQRVIHVQSRKEIDYTAVWHVFILAMCNAHAIWKENRLYCRLSHINFGNSEFSYTLTHLTKCKIIRFMKF